MSWFLILDWSVFKESCYDCGSSRLITQYRLVSIAISETVNEYESTLQRAARDLGRPCEHIRYSRIQTQRWWGLLFCARPCICGLFLVGGDWYDAAVSEKVRAMSKANPELAEEFHSRAFLDGDKAYARGFMRVLREWKQDKRDEDLIIPRDQQELESRK